MSAGTARIRSVEPLDGFALRLSFEDGSEREVDLEDELWGPIFEPLRENRELFRQLFGPTPLTIGEAVARAKPPPRRASSGSMVVGRMVSRRRRAMARTSSAPLVIFAPRAGSRLARSSRTSGRCPGSTGGGGGTRVGLGWASGRRSGT